LLGLASRRARPPAVCFVMCISSDISDIWHLSGISLAHLVCLSVAHSAVCWGVLAARRRRGRRGARNVFFELCLINTTDHRYVLQNTVPD
jgi:hypothetical protein